MIECPECGYNLTGLPLPHPCPECGFLFDLAFSRAVVEWYRSWRGVLLFSVPTHAAAFLGDSECRRIARRRFLLGIVLPWLLATGVLLLLNGVTVTSKLEKWWEYPNKPGERLDSCSVTRADRVLNFNLHLSEAPGLLYTPRTGTIRHERRLSASYTLGWPQPDNFAWWCLTMPSLALAGLLALLVEACVVPRLTASPRMRLTSRWPLIPAFAVVYIPTVLLIAMAATCACLSRRYYSYSAFVSLILPLAAGIILIGGAVQGVRLLGACRPRQNTFPGSIRVAVFAAFLVLPPAAWVLAAWLILGH